MKKKLFVIKRNGDVVASLLLGHWHGIMAHNIDQNTANVYTLHRIQ